MNREKEIFNLIEKIVEKHGFLLVDTVIRGEKMNRVIEVYIDNETGISADNCAGVSHDLGALFDENDFFSGKYRLDVSSPGIGRPLKYFQQYKKHVGREFEVEYSLSEGTTSSFKGVLTKSEDNKLWFTSNNSELIIDFEKVIKAKVLISF